MRRSYMELFENKSDKLLLMIEKALELGIPRHNLCFIIDTTNDNDIILTSTYGVLINTPRFFRGAPRFNDIPIFVYQIDKGTHTIKISGRKKNLVDYIVKIENND